MLAEALWKGAPQKVIVLYAKVIELLKVFPSSTGSVKVRVNPRGPPRKAKYSLATDSELVP